MEIKTKHICKVIPTADGLNANLVWKIRKRLPRPKRTIWLWNIA